MAAISFAVTPGVGLRAEDEVAAKSVELGEVGFHAFGLRFLIELAHLLFVVRLRGRSVLCLAHAAIETRRGRESNCRSLVARIACWLLRVVGVEKQASEANFDLCQRSPVVLCEPLAMRPSDEPGPHREAPEPKPSLVEEARRIIEQYADDLREIIRKLRRHFH
jgi:hypothetical protein